MKNQSKKVLCLSLVMALSMNISIAQAQVSALATTSSTAAATPSVDETLKKSHELRSQLEHDILEINQELLDRDAKEGGQTLKTGPGTALLFAVFTGSVLAVMSHVDEMNSTIEVGARSKAELENTLVLLKNNRQMLYQSFELKKLMASNNIAADQVTARMDSMITSLEANLQLLKSKKVNDPVATRRLFLYSEIIEGNVSHLKELRAAVMKPQVSELELKALSQKSLDMVKNQKVMRAKLTKDYIYQMRNLGKFVQFGEKAKIYKKTLLGASFAALTSAVAYFGYKLNFGEKSVHDMSLDELKFALDEKTKAFISVEEKINNLNIDQIEMRLSASQE